MLPMPRIPKQLAQAIKMIQNTKDKTQTGLKRVENAGWVVVEQGSNKKNRLGELKRQGHEVYLVFQGNAYWGCVINSVAFKAINNQTQQDQQEEAETEVQDKPPFEKAKSK